MESNDRVRLLSSTLLSISCVAIVTGSSPGGGLTLCFLVLPNTGDTDWLRRPPCSVGLDVRCLLLSAVCDSVWAELVICPTSASVSSPWDMCSGRLPLLQSGAGRGDSPLGTVRV